MKQVKVNWHEVIPQYRTINLEDNEILCDKCNGAVLILQGNSLVQCHNCRSGVQTLCKHCGKRLTGYTTWCDCEKARSIRESEQAQKECDKWNSKPKLTIKEVIEKGYEYLYDEVSEKFFDIDSIDEYIEEEQYDNSDYTPRLYTTSKTSLHIDANHILESATEELHEDAYDNISGSEVKELQELLDNWCSKITGTDSYEPDYKFAVIWENVPNCNPLGE